MDALLDRKVAHEIVLPNLLQPRGYKSLDAVRTDGEVTGRTAGEARGKADAVLAILETRGLPVAEDQRARILATTDRATLF